MGSASNASENARVGEQRAERKSLPDTFNVNGLHGESAAVLREADYVVSAKQWALHTC
jgi:hypothetical protein